ncbi:2196_t:CDS:10 [Paraglomus occultum]|uniref:2196_t:CDS:1 n=1 Tax=Paraglomus occultum TaxID=144539 RepID=A0A9N8VTP4_9GLOM|nr:2196_t:CDS:10 [Paraglomus occultum]
MDPYRPPPYAPYRPPYSMPGSIPSGIPNFGQPMHRPGFVPGPFHGRPGFGHPPRSGFTVQVPGGPAAGNSNESEKLTTLFIGGISTGVTDEWMEKVLKTCGALKAWKRVKDQSGNPKAFGFAEYANADSVLRALRVLGGEGAADERKDNGVVLPALEEGTSPKKLLVRADEETRKYLDQYEAARPRTAHDSEQDKNALLAVIAVIEEMTKPQDQSNSPSSKSLQEDAKSTTSSLAAENLEKNEETDLPADLPPEQKDLIYREIAIFREPKAEKDREERRRGNGDRDRDNRDRQFGQYQQPRERRWEQREAKFARQYDREIRQEADQKEKEIRDREIMARKLAEWNDDVEAERGTEQYYRDRSRWWYHRQQVRARELAADEQDRLQEQEEIEAEKRRQQRERALEERKQNEELIENEKVTKPLSETDTNSTPNVQDINGSTQTNNGGIKAKLTLNITNKRRAAVMAAAADDEESDEDESETRWKRRALVPLEYKKEELWKWEVKWDELDENILNKKLQPFVSKKIVHYLGEQEDELESFVMDQLRRRRPADELTKEMETTLDEDAEIFVMKLWRMLIFETECKTRKI